MSKQKITVLRDQITVLRQEYIKIIDDESDSDAEGDYTTSYKLASNLIQSLKLLTESYNLQENKAEKILLFASMKKVAIDCVNQLQAGANNEDMNSLLLLGSILIESDKLLPANPNSTLRRAHEYLTEAINKGSLDAVSALARLHALNPYLRGVGTLTDKCQWFLDSKEEFSKHTPGTCGCEGICKKLSQKFDISFEEFVHSHNNNALNHAVAQICLNDDNTTKKIKWLSELVESKFLASHNGFAAIENLVSSKIIQSVDKLHDTQFIKDRVSSNKNYCSEVAVLSFAEQYTRKGSQVGSHIS